MKTAFRACVAALAVVGALTASAASAQDYRIAYGDLDLSTAEGAAVWDQRVQATAEAYCSAPDRPNPLVNRTSCLRAIRLEANDGLPKAERAQYAAASARRAIEA